MGLRFVRSEFSKFDSWKQLKSEKRWPKNGMTVLFSSNSQVELLGFIFHHCAIAFHQPKIIAGQNRVSTDAPLWQNSCNNWCVCECMSKLKDRAFRTGYEASVKNGTKRIYIERELVVLRELPTYPTGESDQRSSGQFRVRKIDLWYLAAWR